MTDERIREIVFKTNADHDAVTMHGDYSWMSSAAILQAVHLVITESRRDTLDEVIERLKKQACDKPTEPYGRVRNAMVEVAIAAVEAMKEGR